MCNDVSRIEHIVVLMFENRSFDHMLGALPGVNGVLGADGLPIPDHYNLPDPTKEPSEKTNPKYLVTGIDTSYQLPHDFNHDFSDGMMPDLFGPGTTGHVDGKPINAPAVTYPATNSGFYSTWCFDESGNRVHIQGESALTYFEDGSLKVLHRLAGAFVVCDNWFCDMPGHTMPNRAFMHCATTGTVGICDTDTGQIMNSSIFELIEGAGMTWKIYAPNNHLDSNWMNEHVRTSPNTRRPIKEFAEDALSETLPFYSFVMCWTGSTPTTDTSMHPKSPIQAGENLLAAVYNALHNSKSWKKTLLVVTFDENGGMYDHVVPPATVQPTAGPPQKIVNNGTLAEFDYKLLGPRIPALLISPWLQHGVDSTQYQNTSILRFIEDRTLSLYMVPISNPAFLAPVCLTSRDAAATSIAKAFDQFGLPEARTDCPVDVEGYPGYAWYDGLFGPQVGLSEEEAAQPPMPHMVHVAKMYVTALPGHPDSGKPIDREFRTVAELDSYVQERNEAALRYDQRAGRE